MGRNLSAKTPAKNIAANPPTRKHTNSDGLLVVEKLNPMQAKRRMVSPDGNVSEVSLATGYTIKMKGAGYGSAAFRGNPYGPQILAEKIENGWLPFDECPHAPGADAAGRIQLADGDKPCEGKSSAKECCPHIKRIATKRRAEHSKGQEAKRKNMQGSVEKLLQLAQDQAAESLTAPQRGKGMPRG
jgi:hypothetical protein